MKKIIIFLFAVLIAYWVFRFLIYQIKEEARATMREEFTYDRQFFKNIPVEYED